MANRNKATGTEWETRLEDYINGTYPNLEATRLAQAGRLDKGDLLLRGRLYKVTLEAKAEKKFDLARYVAEAEIESMNAGTDWGFAFVKAPRRRVGQGYAVTTIEQCLKMMEKLL